MGKICSFFITTRKSNIKIIEEKLRKIALDYFREHVDQKLRELIVDEYGDYWQNFLADDYADNVIFELNDIEEFKNGEFMDVKVYIKEVVTG